MSPAGTQDSHSFSIEKVLPHIAAVRLILTVNFKKLYILKNQNLSGSYIGFDVGFVQAVFTEKPNSSVRKNDETYCLLDRFDVSFDFYHFMAPGPMVL